MKDRKFSDLKSGEQFPPGHLFLQGAVPPGLLHILVAGTNDLTPGLENRFGVRVGSHVEANGLQKKVAQVGMVAQMGLLGLAEEREQDTWTEHLVGGVCPFRRRPATRQGEGRGSVGKEQAREHPGGEEQQDSPVLDPAQGPLLNVEVEI